MVKLASVREIRIYGPRPARVRSEYMNAGIYVLATIFLAGGFVAQFSWEPKSGLVLLLIGLGLVIVVNSHDLMAHVVGIDCRLGLVEFDLQLLVVEFAVPVVQALGALVSFLGIFFVFIQAEKGVGYFKLENHALNMLIAGPALWVLGSIHNSCQIYERADGQVQVLQQSVHIPFLMGSLLFLVGAILNHREQAGLIHHSLDLLGLDFVWFSISGSLLFFIGGLMNVVKVFKMLQVDDIRPEKLRGGAQEKLIQGRERDGHIYHSLLSKDLDPPSEVAAIIHGIEFMTKALRINWTFVSCHSKMVAHWVANEASRGFFACQLNFLPPPLDSLLRSLVS